MTGKLYEKKFTYYISAVIKNFLASFPKMTVKRKSRCLVTLESSCNKTWKSLILREMNDAAMSRALALHLSKFKIKTASETTSACIVFVIIPTTTD